jgi:four helix bundle protein
MRKFKDLEVWNLGKSISLEVYKLTIEMPREEIYGLTSQIRRCSISIPSNIAEGCSRNSNKDFVRFLEISIGSAFELETQLILSIELGFIDKENTIKLIEQLNILQQKINSLIISVKKF